MTTTYLAGDRRDLLKSITRLAAASTAAEALLATVELCAPDDAPVVGWLVDDDGRGPLLLMRGVDEGRRSRISTAFGREVADRPLTPPALARLRTRLEGLLGDHVHVATAGDATIAVACGQDPVLGEWVDEVVDVLESTMERQRELRIARSQVEGRDLGIALTAHELRGPLLGAKFAIERAAASDQVEAGDLLRRAHDELRLLSELVDPLLRWAAGNDVLLRHARFDLVRCVRDAVASCGFEAGVDRATMAADADEIMMVGDMAQLRAAIANLVRNALGYSPADAAVDIRVRREGHVARILVRDEGPGVSSDERDLIFDPFGRGVVGERTRGGKGLGLFIARRVVEAHLGEIWLSSHAGGTTFGIDLPVEVQEVRASAS